MAANQVRCAGDLELLDKLKTNRDIARVIERLDEDETPRGVRARLLGTSVRITEAMSPELLYIAAHCRDVLDVDAQLETFVFPSATFNAAAVKPEDGRLFVLFSSSLLESFEPAEIEFVMGHELGHHLFQHHDMPIGALVNGQVDLDPATVLSLFAWSRYAEISADRAGLACVRKMEPVASAFFKLASGLSNGAVKMLPELFVEQLGDMREELHRGRSAEGVVRADWFSTHPFSPLRIRAAKAFAESTYFGGARPIDDVEGEVNDLMALMEPSYLEETSPEAEMMRRLLFTGGVVVAAAANGISDAERAALEKLLGEGRLGTRELDVEAISADLERRARDVSEEVPFLRRVQVIRDLCLIALADHRVEEAERAALYRIAELVGVQRDSVDRALDNPPELD
ncbi:MAG: M48 family metallopeptidase [Deltaproteobacteria bacterium]|jgi:uncharacterized tellurite resistance protein B-like protein